MPFEILTDRLLAGRAFYTLRSPDGLTSATILPSLAFNCSSWQVRRHNRLHELLYADPLFEDPVVPTRGGIPILFPFPNRIRDGRFTWKGRKYSLPKNDSTKKNAIHGFVCRSPWRLVRKGADADRAWITGQFQGSRDAPEARKLWPADYLLRVTYTLSVRGLRIDAEVENPDKAELPFGLGYHPYFRLPSTPPGVPTLEIPARKYWVLQDNLPTGTLRALTPRLDFQAPRPLGDTALDDALTDLAGANPEQPGGRLVRAALQTGPERPTVRLLADPSFRELVVFTPPHRKAVCLEPYTCVTDGINLQRKKIETGLLVLPAGGKWTGSIELQVVDHPLSDSGVDGMS